MAKRTAVIDIGSNSVRMVIYEKTSRFAFHLLRESKSPVRIGEGAYEQKGYLTQASMQRAFDTLKEYSALAQNYKCHKILAVATSALRDAPNRSQFLNRVSKSLHFNIKVINGDTEAYYGGLAAAAMLPDRSGVTIDIGGGSTELALIEDNIVVETLTLNIGTVRLKELFFDKDAQVHAIEYIQEELKNIPQNFLHHKVIGIGGTIRALSNAYLKQEQYPIKVLHGFGYKTKNIKKFANKVIQSSDEKLKKLGIKADRFDVIGVGTMIFMQILEHLQAKEVTVSSVGVREGVYVNDLLRTQKYPRFPAGFNPTLRSIMDRYTHNPRSSRLLEKCVYELFDTLQAPLNLDSDLRFYVGKAALLSEIGIELNYYDYERHSFYLILHSLYGYSHKETLLIATLVRYFNKKKPSKAFKDKYKKLLPKHKKIKNLLYILLLAKSMMRIRPKQIPFQITYKDQTLYLKSLEANHLAIEKIEKLSHPIPVVIE